MEAGGCGRSWAFHGFRAASLPELPLALPEEVPPRRRSASFFPGGSPVIFSRSSFLSPGAIARVVGAWRLWDPPLLLGRASGDGVKCGELKRGATGVGGVETARATRDVARPPAASATRRSCPAPPCVSASVALAAARRGEARRQLSSLGSFAWRGHLAPPVVWSNGPAGWRVGPFLL